jgi:hypothetical protein
LRKKETEFAVLKSGISKRGRNSNNSVVIETAPNSPKITNKSKRRFTEIMRYDQIYNRIEDDSYNDYE